MRGILVLAGLVAFATVAVAPPTGKTGQQAADHPTEPEDHHGNASQEPHADGEHIEEHEEDQNEEEENVFASVELAATNADLAIKLMKRALSVLLESSASAMEHTEALLKSGVTSVNSIARGASAAATQLGIPPEPPAPAKAVQKSPPEPKKQGWSWWG